MRAVVLMAMIILASAAVLSLLGQSRCDRSLVAVDSRDTMQIVTFFTDCGGNSLATEVGFAGPGRQAETAETVFVLPGKEAARHVIIEERDNLIAIQFPRGSQMVSKRTEWEGKAIQYVETAALKEDASADALD